jgi:hypothetical protein
VLDLLLLGRKTSPNFFWDARGGVLPPGATFTRASSGWSFNNSGTLVSSSTNVARFDYEPSTLAPLGYLAEPQSTNALLWSQEVSGGVHTAWNNSNTTVALAAATAPDGTTTANHWVETSSASVARAHYQTITLATNTPIGISAFFKAGTRTVVSLLLDGGSNQNVTTVFDLVAGTMSESHVGSTSGTLLNNTIRNVGNGWWRVTMLAKVSTANPNVAFQFMPNASGNTYDAHGQVAYNGNGTGDVYVWGAQADTVGIGVTSYIPTTTATVTRSADLLSLPLSSVSGWNGNVGGVFVVTYRLYSVADSATTEQKAMWVQDAGTTNQLDFRAMAGTQAGAFAIGQLTRSNGVIQINNASNASPIPTAFLRRRTAFGWGTSRGQIASEGTMVSTTSGSYLLPVGMTTFNPGGNVAQLNGSIESIAYYAGARSDAFVQAVTQ